MLHHYRLHVKNELVEIVTIEDLEFEKVIEEYEEVLEPPLTD